ncbi:MAG TPA: glutamate racemase, partial [Candidatus Cryptobacteroides sp.]|nr:glutamate racemase [Candidatus Cryptobacteroides sp.]
MAIIGIMDSGVGGLSVFREIRKALPDERYIYYSDNANCPYGEKTPDFIRDRLRTITDIFLARGAQAA